MRKIASPQELQTELRRLLAYAQTEKPSREKLASEMRGLARRVLGSLQWHSEPYSEDPDDPELEGLELRSSGNVIVQPSDRPLPEGFGPLDKHDGSTIRSLIRKGKLSHFEVYTYQGQIGCEIEVTFDNKASDRPENEAEDIIENLASHGFPVFEFASLQWLNSRDAKSPRGNWFLYFVIFGKKV